MSQDQAPYIGDRSRVPALAAGAKPLAIIPTSLEEVFRVGQYAVASGLCAHKTPEAATIAILHGLEIGLTPMVALQWIAVINNRPAIWGDAALALVRKSSLCGSFKEWFEGEGDALTAYCETHRVGDLDPVKESFSVADAKKAKLWDERNRVTRKRRDGGGTYEADNDSPWYRFPRRMLKFRARGWCLRAAYPDVLLGLHLQEELDEGNRMIDITPTGEQNAARLSEKLAAVNETSNLDVDHVERESAAVAGEPEKQPDPPAPDYEAHLAAFKTAIAAYDDSDDLNEFVKTFGRRAGEEWWSSAPDDVKARANEIFIARWNDLAETGDDGEAQDGDDAGPTDTELLAQFEAACAACKTVEEVNAAFKAIDGEGGWYSEKGKGDRRVAVGAIMRRYTESLTVAAMKAAEPAREAKVEAAKRDAKSKARADIDPQLLAEARIATKNGSRKFKLWCGKLNVKEYDSLAPVMKELEKAAKDADQL